MNVLLVEDDAIILEGLKSIIRRLDHKVFACTSVISALDLLESNIIDVAFLDIDLEGTKDGIWLANFINNHYRIPFVYTTGNDADEVINRAMKTNPSSYLIKPFKQKDVTTSLELMKNRKRDNNHGDNNSIGVAPETISKILFENIMYIEKFKDNECIMYTNTFSEKIDKNFDELKLILPKTFVLLHPNVFVNSIYIVSMNSSYAELKEGFLVPVSSEYFKNLQQEKLV